MTRCWPIKRKLALCLSLLLVTLLILSCSGFRGLYSYRALVKEISLRASELPLASELFHHVSDLRMLRQRIVDCYRIERQYPVEGHAYRMERSLQLQAFEEKLRQVRDTVQRYRGKLSEQLRPQGAPRIIGDQRDEQRTLREFDRTLREVSRLVQDPQWVSMTDQAESMQDLLDELSSIAARLPTFLQHRMQFFARDVRLKYRTLIILSWLTSIAALLLSLILGRLFYVWVLAPLRLLIHGSRLVASGNFYHRIRLDTQDEMAELAQAMNHMTTRFQEIRDDLDRKVQQRTREVLRSEQLASVGFLAAGVAHEINNPLAAIALCAESLEERLDEIIQADDARPDEDHNPSITVARNYLRMIQDEAFRCSKITEGLLDFSRIGNAQREDLDLRLLIEATVQMLKHLEACKEKELIVDCPEPVIARVNAHEFKQVLLNLICNALDSVDPGGWVRISLCAREPWARVTVQDNGCGMTDEVRQNLFEPFFTRRRSGQGTGLGLAITYRIVQDHHGSITADSPGPGQGSTMVVTLPLSSADTDSLQEQHHHYSAA